MKWKFNLASCYGLAFVLFFTFGCVSPKTNFKPNIVLINIDDLGWKDLGYMGSTFYETPNIDALSSDSRVFTNAYAAASNCAPSRASLFSGLWPNRHGVFTVGNSDRGKSESRKLIPTKNRTILSDSFPTMVEFLNNADYSTCHSGKWHISKDPTQAGFDVNIGGADNGHPKSYNPPFLNVDVEATQGERLTNVIMDKTLDFVNEVKGPFFINYAPYAVHTPIQGVDSLVNKYNSKDSSSKFSNAEYASMIENLDENIGRLISALKNLELLKNTIIILTSDNGGLYGITDQIPLRAGKGSYYEGGIRVPFFVYWQNEISPGRSDFPVSQLDIFPTIVDLVNPVEIIKLDGLSLTNHLLENKSLPSRNLFWHFPIYLQAYNKNDNQNRDALFRTRPGSLIRKGDWKLHYYYEDEGIELYNLKNDISESKNLITEYPEIQIELMNELNQWLELTHAPIPKELNPEFIE